MNVFFVVVCAYAVVVRTGSNSDLAASSSATTTTATVTHSRAWLPCEVETMAAANSEPAAGVGKAFSPEGSGYFERIYRSLKKATKGTEVVIVGWRFELDTPLLGFAPPGTDPATKELLEGSTLLAMLRAATSRGAIVYVQFWTNTMNYALRNNMMGFGVKEKAAALRKLGVRVFVDSGRGFLRSGSAGRWDTHIKAVIFDRRVAFVGGYDFCKSRIGTTEHTLPDKRLQPDPDTVTGYNLPWEDVQIRVDGPTAVQVVSIMRERWLDWCSADNTVLDKLENFFSAKGAQCSPGYILPATLEFPDGYVSPYKVSAELDLSLPYKEAENSCRLDLSGNDNNLFGNFEEIYHDYIKAIDESKSYIYIENQYFISRGIHETISSWRPSSLLPDGMLRHLLQPMASNLIAKHLYARIVRAIVGDEDFSVVVVMPLSTDFKPTFLLGYRTMFHAKQGLYANVRKYLATYRPGVPVEKYLSVNFLGAVAELSSTERAFYAVYIHTKVMVVDGTYASVGSANINDRSMMERDGEMNVVVRGPAAQGVVDTLMVSHAGGAQLRPQHFAEDFAAVGAHNGDMLKATFGLDLANGVDTRSGARLLGPEADLRLGAGTSWFKRHADRPELRGQIFNYSPELWGDTDALYTSWKDDVFEIDDLFY